jgi:hypothetical protein
LSCSRKITGALMTRMRTLSLMVRTLELNAIDADYLEITT